MGQEVRPPAKHAIDHFKELHRLEHENQEEGRLLAKCWGVNWLTRYQIKENRFMTTKPVLLTTSYILAISHS